MCVCVLCVYMCVCMYVRMTPPRGGALGTRACIHTETHAHTHPKPDILSLSRARARSCSRSLLLSLSLPLSFCAQINPNVQDIFGDTALHDAARFGHVPVSRVLAKGVCVCVCVWSRSSLPRPGQGCVCARAHARA